MDGSLRVCALGDNYIAGAEYTVVEGPDVNADDMSDTVITEGPLAGILEFELIRPDGGFPKLLKIRVLESVIFADDPTDPNCKAFADYIRSLDPAPGSELAILLEHLGQIISPDELCNIIKRILPSTYSGLEWVNLDSQKTLFDAISSTQCQFNPDCWEQGGQFWSRFTGWFEDYDTREDMPGFDSKNGTFTVGYDHYVGSGWRLGLLGSYIHNNVKWDGGIAKGNVDSLQGCIYTKYCGRLLYADVAVAAGLNWYDVTREIDLGEVKLRSVTTSRGYPVAVRGKLGWNGRISESLILSPEASFSYHYLHLDSFAEKSPSAVDWEVESKDSSFIRTDLGLLASKMYEWNDYQVVFYAGLSWVMNCPIRSGDYTIKLVNTTSPDTFDIFTFDDWVNRVSPKVGMKVNPPGSCNTFELNYTGEYNGQETYHAASFAIQAAF